MSYLVELVFDGTSMAAAAGLLDDLLARLSATPAVDVDGVLMASAPRGHDLVASIKAYASIPPGEFWLPNFGPVPDVAFRVLNVDGAWDVELNFDLDDLTAPELLTSPLHAFARTLAERHGVTLYYAGLEPAVDEDTRLFTGLVVGPIRISALPRRGR